MASTPLVPPINFSMVCDSVYRSGEPCPINFPFLTTLNLRRLVYLSSKPPSQALLLFANTRGIILVHYSDNDNEKVSLSRNNSQQSLPSVDSIDSSPPSSLVSTLALPSQTNTGAEYRPILSENTVQSVLSMIVNPTMHPVLVCCHYGTDRTGVVIGCLRKLHRWNLASIYSEFRRYHSSLSGSSALPLRNDQEQFIELFEYDSGATQPSQSSNHSTKHSASAPINIAITP